MAEPVADEVPDVDGVAETSIVFGQLVSIVHELSLPSHIASCLLENVLVGTGVDCKFQKRYKVG